MKLEEKELSNSVGKKVTFTIVTDDKKVGKAKIKIYQIS